MNIEWTTGIRLVADLKEWDENPRKITDTDFEKLKSAIVARGFHDVIKIDVDNTILSGHQRKRALTELGITEVNVLYPSRALTENERREIAIESNLHRGKFDFDILANTFDTDMLLDLGMSKMQLDLTPKKEPEEDQLIKQSDSHVEGDIKQLVFFLKSSDFEGIHARLDRVAAETGTENHTDAFLKLLEDWEFDNMGTDISE